MRFKEKYASKFRNIKTHTHQGTITEGEEGIVQIQLTSSLK
jgi:hypothetical protein